MPLDRSITFSLTGTNGSPDVRITAVEVDGGALDLTVTVLETASVTADLRGLFFDLVQDGKLAGLKATPSGTPTITDFDTVDVLSLKNGANMNGAAQPFDVGIEFGTQGIGKDDIKAAKFVLSNDSGDLTLDDIAHVDFGVRLASIGVPGSNKRQEKDGAKLVTTSPAAPHAHDDSAHIFEDGAAGLGDPQAAAKGVKMLVLGNDTDADAGDVLQVVQVEGAQHGSVTIVDGPDADNLPGDAVLYTPATDWSGQDAFVYSVSDGHGGTDSAQVSVTVTAVADKPDVQVSVIDAADKVNEVRLQVVARPTDDDGSESLGGIGVGALPAGASIQLLGGPVQGAQGQVTQQYLLTLPEGQSIDRALSFSAMATEATNGDTESGSASVALRAVHQLNERTVTLESGDASLWANGSGPNTQILGPLLGIEAGPNLDLYPYPIHYQLQATIHTGFQPFLQVEGGTIDAAVDYEVTVESTHNRTTDTLLITPSAALSGGSFTTHGPGGHMGIDFVFGYDIGVKLGIDFDGDLGSTLEAYLVDMHMGNQWTLANLIDIEDGDPGFGIDTSWLNGTSGSVQWPQVDIHGGAFDSVSGSVKGSGEAAFIDVAADLDSLLLGSVLGNVSPFDIPVVADIDVDPLNDVAGFLRLLDADVSAQLKLAQTLELSAKDMHATLTFENGAKLPVTFGQELLIQNALATYDAPAQGGNGNGRVEYTLSFDGVAELHNKTDVKVEKTIDYKVLELDIDYDIDWVVYKEAGSFDQALVHVHETAVDVVGVANQSFDLVLQTASWGLDAGL